jgi:hypothetical protein
MFFLSKKNLFCSEKVFVSLSLPCATTKLNKFFEWRRRLGNNFEKKDCFSSPRASGAFFLLTI